MILSFFFCKKVNKTSRQFGNPGEDDCPDLEEIDGNGIKCEDDDSFRIGNNCVEPYGEKTIDEDDMEAYFNGKL